MNRFRSILLMSSLIGVLASISASAQSQESSAAQNQMPADKMEKMRQAKENMMGKHAMKATVTSVDKQSGLVKVNAGGMDLTVHFPPASLTNVNPNDIITLYLGFTK